MRVYGTDGINLGGQGHLAVYGTDGRLVADAVGGSNFVQATATIAGTNISGTIASNVISLSVAAPGGGNLNVSAGTTSNNMTAITFDNAGGVSFGLNGSVVTAAAPAPGAGLAAIYDGANSISSGTIRFTNANGVSFSINGQTISGSVRTDYRNSTDAVGLATAQTNVTWTVNSAGVSLNAGGYAGTGFTSTTTAGTEIKATVNTAGVSMAVPAYLTAGGGGLTNINVSAGTTSNNLSNLVFTNGNGVTFGLNGSTISASVNAGGGGATISSYQNVEASLQSMTWNGLSISHAVAFMLPQAGSFSFLRLPVIFTQSSVALTTQASSANMSVQRWHTFNAVVYSIGTGASSKSLQSVASGSAGWTILNSASIAANGTQGSYTQAMTFQHQGSQVTRSTQYSASSTVMPISSGFFTGFTQGRMLDINFANSLSAGPYWLIAGYTSSSSANSARISSARTAGAWYSNHYGAAQTNVAFSEFNTNGAEGLLGAGSFSTAPGGTTASLHITQISSSGSHNKMMFQLLRSA